MTKNCQKINPQGRLLEHLGPLMGLFGGSWTNMKALRATFWYNYALIDQTFDRYFVEKLIFLFLTPV